jgi:ribosomal protein S18 acetylase RimI-like enzyme
VQVRPATTNDLETLVALNAFVQRRHAEELPDLFKLPADSPEVIHPFRTILEATESLVLLAEAEEPIGYLYAQFQIRPASWARLELHVFYIHHLVVAPKHRHHGAGTALLSEALKVARARGIKRVELDVWSFNSEAKRFWSKHGFNVFNEKMQLPSEYLSLRNKR